jgi:hypothetical protein
MLAGRDFVILIVTVTLLMVTLFGVGS